MVYGLYWDIFCLIGLLVGGLILILFGGEVIFYVFVVCLLVVGLCLIYIIEKFEYKVIRKMNG